MFYKRKEKNYMEKYKKFYRDISHFDLFLYILFYKIIKFCEPSLNELRVD